ncbi:MAG: response regulator [Lentisphaerae bacterium]|nr:response regulator [Lentisphaerota bacterium]
MTTENGEGQRQELHVDGSYKELLDTIKRNMDPDSNTVLLVDDERAIRKKVARDVQSCAPNLVVYEAANGKEALEKLYQIRCEHYRDPLLIICDLQMPVMDGWEFIRRMYKDYESQGKTSGIPIIVLSSSSGEKGVRFISKKSVHDDSLGYTPLVTVAKEMCVDKSHYDAAGEKGLLSWLQYFVDE